MKAFYELTKEYLRVDPQMLKHDIVTSKGTGGSLARLDDWNPFAKRPDAGPMHTRWALTRVLYNTVTHRAVGTPGEPFPERMERVSGDEETGADIVPASFRREWERHWK